MRLLARAIRHLPDRLLHGRRRSAALTRLAEGPADRILVLCHGNIIRSPFVERRLAAAGAEARSGGFIGPGRRSPPEAQEAARVHRVNLSGHISKLVTEEDLRWAELVLVMDGIQERRARELHGAAGPSIVRLGDLDPQPIERRAIPDPFGEGEPVFRSTYQRLLRCLEPLESRLRGGG